MGLLEESYARIAERDKLQAEERARCEAFFAEKRKPHIVITRVNHVCEECSKPIPIGAHALIKAIPILGSRFQEGMRSIYYCEQCADAKLQ